MHLAIARLTGVNMFPIIKIKIKDICKPAASIVDAVASFTFPIAPSDGHPNSIPGNEKIIIGSIHLKSSDAGTYF